MRPLARSLVVGGSLILAACGGGGGGGGESEGLLPLRDEDELVALMTPNTTTNEFRVSHSGPTIYTAWVERGSTGDAVAFNRSLDGGRTWLAENLRVDDPATGDAHDLRMACDGPRVYLVYRKGDDALSSIRLQRSLDSGATFLPDETLVNAPAGSFVNDPAIVCRGLTVHVAWADGRTTSSFPNQDIRYNRSTDGGATFPPVDVRLDTDAPGAGNSHHVSLCGDGAALYAAWIDTRAGVTTVRSNRSVDGGDTFLASDVQVSHAGVAALDVSSSMSVACEGDAFVVAWSDVRGARINVFVNRSVDGGRTFLATDVNPSPTPNLPGASPSLVLEGSTLHVVWQRGSSLRYNRSADAGATFLPEDVLLLDVEGDSTKAGRPALVGAGGSLVAAWSAQALSGGHQDIFLAVSADGGATFETARADTDPPGASLSFQPGPCLFEGTLAVVWAEQRDGALQVRTNRTAR